ncbi:MAG TPA: hypothetical protein VEY12_09440 [Thermoplasmata archaeon]|nr:hypothetical protein [Thermoplasmata archaeon]
MSSTPPVPTAATPLPEPLRLPHGSVRGVLAIVLMLTFGFLLARDSSAPTVLVNAVVVCLAFFFGSHGLAPVPTATPAPGVAPTKRPRTVRILLLIGFAGLAGWFLRSGISLQSLPPELIQVWEVLAGYVIGFGVSWAFHHRAHENVVRRRLALAFRDLSAAGALGLTLFACYTMAAGLAGTIGSAVEQGLSLIITYYFGSRVLPH